MTWQNWIIAGAALLFALWVLARMATPAVSAPRKPVEGLREALARVREATDPRAKSEAMVVAGDLLASSGVGVNSATAYYLRAMRLDPASLAPLTRLATSLRGRPRALERILWKRLASVPWDGATRPVAARAAELLASGTTGRRVEREVLAKLAATLRA